MGGRRRVACRTVVVLAAVAPLFVAACELGGKQSPNGVVDTRPPGLDATPGTPPGDAARATGSSDARAGSDAATTRDGAGGDVDGGDVGSLHDGATGNDGGPRDGGTDGSPGIDAGIVFDAATPPLADGAILGAPVLTRISGKLDAATPDDSYYEPAIAPDGRLVLFRGSGDIAGFPANSNRIAIGYDRTTGGRTRAQLLMDTVQTAATREMQWAWATDDRHLVIATRTALVGTDENNNDDVYLYDLATRTPTLVSQNTNGRAGHGSSVNPATSADGRVIAFVSTADDLVPGDTNGEADVFAYDVQAGTMTRASVTATGGQASGPSAVPFGISATYPADRLAVSPDGRFVAFNSGTNLGLGAARGIYVKDLQSGTLTQVPARVSDPSAAAMGFVPQFSEDGQVLAFYTETSSDPPWCLPFRIWYRATGNVVCVPHDPAVRGARALTFALSGNGSRIAYVGKDPTSSSLISDFATYLVDVGTGAAALVSRLPNGDDVSQARSEHVSLSRDGRSVAFEVWANRDLATGATMSLSRSQIYVAAFPGASTGATSANAWADGGAPGPATQVVASRPSACARTSAGRVWCWGDSFGNSGSMGTTVIAGAPVPVEVPGVSDVVQLAASGLGYCARDSVGAVRCWGSLTSTPRPNRAPRLVGSLPPVEYVGGGGDHMCAVAAGVVHCWGTNTAGQLGDGTTATRPETAAAVPGLTGIVAVAGGTDHTCALSSQGTVHCWGGNVTGQLGAPPSSGSSTPLRVAGISNATAIAASGLTSCALVGGVPWCWGAAGDGVLGRVPDAGVANHLPAPVDGVSNATLLAMGWNVACAGNGTTGLACWGRDTSGELGRGVVGGGVKRAAPVVGLTGVTSIAIGQYDVGNHVCATTTGGTPFCWGDYDVVGHLDVTANTGTPHPVGAFP